MFHWVLSLNRLIIIYFSSSVFDVVFSCSRDALVFFFFDDDTGKLRKMPVLLTRRRIDDLMFTS